MRVEQIGDCRLYLGDSGEIVPSLSGEYNSIVTDPPYGLGDRMQGGTWGANQKYMEMREWDQQTPSLDFIIETGLPTIVWGGNYFTLPVSRNWLVWNKPRRGMTMADGELAWCSWDGNLRICDSYEPNGSYERHHPTQKHISVMTWCLKQLPAGCTTILDPFMGSGTTGVACVKTGMKFIGIEVEPKYFDIACRRVEQAYAQPDLFIEPPAKQVQIAIEL